MINLIEAVFLSKKSALQKSAYVIYSKKVDSGSVAWQSMCLYSSTNLRVHFSTIVVVCNGEGSADKSEKTHN